MTGQYHFWSNATELEFVTEFAVMNAANIYLKVTCWDVSWTKEKQILQTFYKIYPPKRHYHFIYCCILNPHTKYKAVLSSQPASDKSAVNFLFVFVF